MDDAGCVGRGQRVGDLDGVGHRRLQWKRFSCNSLIQALALEELHRDEVAPVRLPDLCRW